MKEVVLDTETTEFQLKKVQNIEIDIELENLIQQKNFIVI